MLPVIYLLIVLYYNKIITSTAQSTSTLLGIVTAELAVDHNRAAMIVVHPPSAAVCIGTIGVSAYNATAVQHSICIGPAAGNYVLAILIIIDKGRTIVTR